MNVFTQAVREAMEAAANAGLTRERRLKLADETMKWAAGRVKGKGPDVDKKMAMLERRVKQLMLGIEVLVDGESRLVLKPRGSDEGTLVFLRLGSRWFYGSEEVTDFILGGVFGAIPA